MNDKQIDELINKVLREDQTLPEGLSERLEQQIDAWAAAEKKEAIRSSFRRRSLYWLSGAAAVALLTKNILLILFLCCTSICFAQNKLFDKYSEMDNVTSVYISKAMFQMMPKIETNGLNLMNLKGKIEGLQVLTTENNSIKEKMRDDFKKLISKDHQELMRVKDGKTRATFYVKQKGDLISEMIMLADTDNSFNVIQLLGNFTLQDIQEITKEMNK